MAKPPFDIELFAADKAKRLLLHCCCAPCALGVPESLLRDPRVTLYFENSNLIDAAEYDRRLDALKTVAAFFNAELIAAPFAPVGFFDAAAGLEDEREGGARCEVCILNRLNRAADYAAANGFKLMTTTLTTGPKKNAALVNGLGARAAENAGITWLSADFKKQDGYLNSVRQSQAMGLYRQDFCGCVYSKKARRYDA